MKAQPQESFAARARIFNADSPDQRDDPLRLVALAAEVHREATSNLADAARQYSRHAHEADRLERLEANAYDMVKAAKLAMVRAVMLADPRPTPTEAEWYGHAPIWKTTVGGFLYALIPGRDTDAPDNDDDPAELVSLMILDLATIGGVR